MNAPDKKTSPAYAAPALEKGLDIIELLCRSPAPLSQKEIGSQLGRSVGELYRMMTCLIERGYVTGVGERFTTTTKLFELVHLNPPTQRLLSEAGPVMRRLSDLLGQSCHLTIYSGGRQIVLLKEDAPGSMGFSVRVGAELDVLISASGQVLIAFQEPTTRRLRIQESLTLRPDQASPSLDDTIDAVRARGFASFPSAQVRGLHAVSFPVLNLQGTALAALIVPYAERIDRTAQTSIAEVEHELSLASADLSERIGGSSAV